MRGALVLAAGLLLATTPTSAVELKLLVGGAMAETFHEVGDAYEKKSGNTLSITVDNSGALQRRLRAGEPADVILLAAQGMDALEKENRIVPGSRIELARAQMAVAIRADAPPLDLSSADAFKRALLNARAIALTDPRGGGTAGVYMEEILRDLGIADAVRAKIIYSTQGQFVTEAVAKGQAELGVTFTSEILPNRGAKVALLPAELQRPTNYAAAIPSGAAHPAEARALLQEFKTPFAHETIRKAGLEPLAR